MVIKAQYPKIEILSISNVQYVKIHWEIFFIFKGNLRIKDLKIYDPRIVGFFVEYLRFLLKSTNSSNR